LQNIEELGFYGANDAIGIVGIEEVEGAKCIILYVLV
jgi:hypothetical protein